MSKLLVSICMLFFLPLSINASERNSESGFIDFNIYPYMSDVDNDNVVTINIGAKLKNRFSYFSLTNVGNQANKSELSDITSFYTEQNLRWKISNESPIDLTLQMNFRSGDDNDRHRLGFRWRLNNTAALESFFKSINLAWSINFHLIQFDNVDADVRQMEHVYKLKFPWITERLYLSGFIDHTFNEDLAAEIPDNPVVSETQLGFRVIDDFYLIAEYRINQYRRADVNNIAAGIEYIVKW